MQTFVQLKPSENVPEPESEIEPDILMTRDAI